MLLIAVSLLSIAPCSDAEQGGGEARSIFERGQELERLGDLAGALEEYQRAEALRPSFRLHRHIGRVLRGLGRYNEALHRFERFLEEGGERITQEQRQWVAQNNEEIQRLVATVQVSAPDGAEVLLDGSSVGRVPIAEPLSLDPGHHVVEVRFEGHRDVRRDLDLEAGEVRTLEILLSSFEPDDVSATPPPTEPEGGVEPSVSQNPPPTPRRRRINRALFYSILGFSASALTGGIVFGALTAGEHDDFDRLNNPDRTIAEEANLIESRNRGESFALSADVLIFSGAVLAVATLILGFFTDFDRTAGDDSNGTTSRVYSITGGVQ